MIAIVAALAFSVPAQAAPPFGRAMVFSGGSLQTAVFLGMLGAAEGAGKSPDVIIAACGGALAAAIVNAFPDPAARRAFAESREFQAFLESVQPAPPGPDGDPASLWSGLRRLAAMHARRWTGRIPPLFDDVMLRVPDRLGVPALDRPFAPGRPRIVIVATRLGFGPEQVGRAVNGQKLYQEVFFTDADTAGYLRGVRSPIALAYPASYVREDTAVVTGATAAAAARASISNPHVFAPAVIDRAYYGTGTIDLYPFEIARHLAAEYSMGFSPGFDPYTERVNIQSVFAYDPIVRTIDVSDAEATWWIDLSDARELFKANGFTPQVSLSGIRTNVPSDPQEFVRRVRAQWAYGHERAAEAFARPPGDKAHIRAMTRWNSSKELRRRHGR